VLLKVVLQCVIPSYIIADTTGNFQSSFVGCFEEMFFYTQKNISRTNTFCLSTFVSSIFSNDADSWNRFPLKFQRAFCWCSIGQSLYKKRMSIGLMEREEACERVIGPFVCDWG
jgi:hypothetical protein